MIAATKTTNRMRTSAATRMHYPQKSPPRSRRAKHCRGVCGTKGNYLDEVWTIDDRTGGITVADLNDNTGSERHFYHQNTLYHVYALTDETGALAEAVQSYDAYGNVTALITGAGTDTTWFTADDVTATNPNVSAIGNPYFYTGQRLDPETGLMHYKNRYYSPQLGRFISRDPIGYEGGINQYQYVASGPTDFTDPLGFCPAGFRKATPFDLASIFLSSGTKTKAKLKEKYPNPPAGNCKIVDACVRIQIFSSTAEYVMPWKVSKLWWSATRLILKVTYTREEMDVLIMYCCDPGKTFKYGYAGTHYNESVTQKLYRQTGRMNFPVWFFVYSGPSKIEKAFLGGMGETIGYAGATFGEIILAPLRMAGVHDDETVHEKIYSGMNDYWRSSLLKGECTQDSCVHVDKTERVK